MKKNNIKEEWDEAHALDMVLGDMISKFTDKELNEMLNQPDEWDEWHPDQSLWAIKYLSVTHTFTNVALVKKSGKLMKQKTLNNWIVLIVEKKTQLPMYSKIKELNIEINLSNINLPS